MFVIKHNGIVYFGSVELPVPDNASHDIGVTTEIDNSLIWKAPNADGIMVIASNNNIVTDLLKDDPSFFCGEITHDKLVAEIIPNLKRLFARFGKVDDDGHMPCGFAMAQNGRAYIIKSNAECDEVGDFDAYHWYSELALSTLTLSQGLEPDDRFRMISNVLKTLFNENFPIQVMNSKTYTHYWIK